MLSIPSTHSLYSRPPCTFSGRAGLRARICSAFSCDMFARVVWLRLREAAKPPTFDLSFAARTCHAWLARLTRARRTRFGRRTARVLLADFWYFSSLKSTIKEKLLYVFLCQYRRESTKNHHNADSQKRGFDSPFFCLFT